MTDNTSSASMPMRPLPVETPEARPGSFDTWPRQAICCGEDPDIFFPAFGDPGTKARQVCTRCPVRADCLEDGIANDEWGIWGGMDREQRRALRGGTDEQGPSARSAGDEAAHV